MAIKRKSSQQAARRRAPARRTSAKPSSSQGLTLLSASPSFTVNDIDRSLAWYCDVLGFTVNDRWEQSGKLMGAELAAGKTKFWIGQDDWKKGRDRVKGQGVRVFCTTTDDIDRLADRIKRNGGTLAQEPKDEWGMRSLSIDDPDGYRITISKNLK